MKPLTCVLILVLGGCSHSVVGKIENGGVISTTVWDEVETRKGIARGAREANPLLTNDAWRRGLIKIGSAGLVIGLAQMLENRDRAIWAHLVRGIAITGYTYAALHNRGVSQ